MDIVVYIRPGENEELRYAIRTWCKNLKFNKLCVVGGPKPVWLKPDIYIENPRRYTTMKQALDNIKKALACDELSENIFLLMDDVFVLEDLTDWPNDFNFNRGPLSLQQENFKRRFGNTVYVGLMGSTNKLLEEKYGINEPLSFEEHAPFWCNRRKLLQILEDNKTNAHEMLYRSVYGNTRLKYTKYKIDSKIRDNAANIPRGTVITSSDDNTFKFGRVGAAIRGWFPYPSKFEA